MLSTGKTLGPLVSFLTPTVIMTPIAATMATSDTGMSLLWNPPSTTGEIPPVRPPEATIPRPDEIIDPAGPSVEIPPPSGISTPPPPLIMPPLANIKRRIRDIFSFQSILLRNAMEAIRTADGARASDEVLGPAIKANYMYDIPPPDVVDYNERRNGKKGKLKSALVWYVSAEAGGVSAASGVREEEGERMEAGGLRDWLSNCFGSGAAPVAPKPKTIANAAYMSELEAALAGPAKEAVRSMVQDIFYNSRPFALTGAELESLKEIFAKPVTGWTRKIFRTIENVRCWNRGYDFVEYELTHTDGTVSIIRAFKKQTLLFQTMGMGSLDMRPIFFEFGISRGKTIEYRFFSNGNILQTDTGHYAEGLAQMRMFVDESVAHGGLYLLQSPDEIVAAGSPNRP